MICALALLTTTLAPPPIHPRPYGRGKAYYHQTALAPYAFANTILRLSFDFSRGIVDGDATDVVTPKRAGLREVSFNSVGLRYTSVTINGAAAAYHVAGDHLYVDLPQGARPTEAFAIEARYTARPTRGIYFIRPDRFYPGMQPEIWSQGETEDNRRWFPTWDEPNQKTPVEQIITVPASWTVIANGHLKSQASLGTSSTWDWIEPSPISTYLIAFTAGPYVKFHTVRNRRGQDLPVDFFSSPADAKWAPLCFGRTHEMVAFFESIIGVPFPWEKYDQTAVERFTAGGMENASATTQTELAIHPPQYDLEQPCDELVSHELAHQWWGDDVTTSDWPNIWLNEGFATYFEELWTQHHFGEAQFEYERWHAQQEYFDETKRYWRPIVDYVYATADDSFDASGYPRPGEVLHMLRYMLGDQRFFGALRDYLNEYAHKNADTGTFFASINGSLGRNLDWFKQEWFYRAAYPHFFVSERYSRRSHALILDVRQRNHDGKPFRMPVNVAVYYGTTFRTMGFTADSNHQAVWIAGISSTPKMVLFDPNDNILRKLDDRKPMAELGYQALHAPYVADRLWALEQLGNARGRDKAMARSLVREAILFDPFYGVRVDALDAAASLDDAQAIDAALRGRDPRVVIAAGDEVENLQTPSDRALIADLRRLSASSNVLIAGAALRGLGATKAHAAYALLVDGLRRHAFREPIARGALLGLASYGDLRAVPLLEAHAAYGVPDAERPDAITALGMLGKRKPALVESFLIRLAQHDPYFRARTAAVRALGRLGASSAIPALQQIEANDTESGVQATAWDAIANIKDSVRRSNRRLRRG